MENRGIEPRSVDAGFPLPPDLSAAMPDPEKVIAFSVNVPPDPDYRESRADTVVRCWIDTVTGRWGIETETGTRVIEADVSSEVALAAISVEGNDPVTRDALVCAVDMARRAVCEAFHRGHP